MTLPYEHEIRLDGVSRFNRDADAELSAVTAYCTCGEWRQTFGGGMALLTVSEIADSHLATHPEPPRMCVTMNDSRPLDGLVGGCQIWSRFTLTGGEGENPGHTEACGACVGGLVAHLVVADDHRMVMVTEHPVYDGHTTTAGTRL